ncbi:hypothetical protein K438DRAFT_1765567 [Mycena galopus ATCC 62051]|nr:hypothetical protein K438DRAFT_1765567 [Mycena galopus ATCC 62051]
MDPSSADAPSIHNGVDLFEYRDLNKKRLGPYDGRVAAHVSVGGTSCYITMNANDVPGVPPAGDDLFLRRDMRWGLHCGRITTVKRTAISARSPDAGEHIETTSQSCGGIRLAAISCPVPLVLQLADSLRRGLDRLCCIPTTFEQMVLGVTNVQRTFLELYGLLDWITVYQPRMTDTSRLGGASNVDVVGVFTMDPVVAEQFHRARLPYWFIRPLSAFHEDNILRVVKPVDPMDWLELAVVEGFSPIKRGPTLEQRIQNIHRGTSMLPWYKNPFASGHTAKAIEMPAPGPSSAPSAAGPSISKSSAMGKSSRRQKPYDRPHPGQNQNQDAHFQQRNKFAHFDTPYMAAAIPSWRAALAAVDMSLPPLCGPHPRNVYVFPEPALVIGSNARCDMYLHHYQLIRDALLYRMGDVDEPHDPVSAAEWRDALQGKLVANVLPMTPARAKEITWELAEMNFRFELCALDEQACGVDRHEDYRLPHLLRLAQLMEDWTYPPRPDAVTLASERKTEYWNRTTINELEECVARYHTQAFYHFFGRAAVVPLRLEQEVMALSPREIDTERGEMDIIRKAGQIGGN